jgi:hypothetical protein
MDKVSKNFKANIIYLWKISWYWKQFSKSFYRKRPTWNAVVFFKLTISPVLENTYFVLSTYIHIKPFKLPLIIFVETKGQELYRSSMWRSLVTVFVTHRHTAWGVQEGRRRPQATRLVSGLPLRWPFTETRQCRYKLHSIMQTRSILISYFISMA